jgi:hypothetical protein
MIIRYVGIEALNIKCDKYEVVMVSLNLLKKILRRKSVVSYDGICFRSGLRKWSAY